MILQKIKIEQKQARLKKDKFRAGVLTTLMAEVQIVGKNALRETTDEEAIKVVTKFLKNLKEAFKAYTGKEMENYETIHIDNVDESTEVLQKRMDMVDEADIYNEFMPKQMTEAELTKAVQDFIGDNPNTIMGQVMQHLKAEYSGTYDGKMASGIVRKLV